MPAEVSNVLYDEVGKADKGRPSVSPHVSIVPSPRLPSSVRGGAGHNHTPLPLRPWRRSPFWRVDHDLTFLATDDYERRNLVASSMGLFSSSSPSASSSEAPSSPLASAPPPRPQQRQQQQQQDEQDNSKPKDWISVMPGKAPSKFSDPCAHAAKASMKCMESNSYDRGKCTEAFEE